MHEPVEFQALAAETFARTHDRTVERRIQVRVNNGSDDVEERFSDGLMYMNSSDLELGIDFGTLGVQTVGLRFNNGAIPPYAQIQNAYIDFEVDRVDTDFAHLLIFGQAADNAEQFRTSRYNVTERPKTDSDVVWFDVPAWETKDAHEQTPNLAHIGSTRQ